MPRRRTDSFNSLSELQRTRLHRKRRLRRIALFAAKMSDLREERRTLECELEADRLRRLRDGLSAP